VRIAARPVELAVISFVALSVGFAAGLWLARQDGGVSGGAGAASRAPHPVGAEDHLELGTLALQQGDLASAERHFAQAVALEPGSARARADLGAVLMLQGRWDEARSELDRARDADPQSPEAWFLTGMLRRDGFADTAGAREAWTRFLELIPSESPQAETVRGWLADLR